MIANSFQKKRNCIYNSLTDVLQNYQTQAKRMYNELIEASNKEKIKYKNSVKTIITSKNINQVTNTYSSQKDNNQMFLKLKQKLKTNDDLIDLLIKKLQECQLKIEQKTIKINELQSKINQYKQHNYSQKQKQNKRNLLQLKHIKNIYQDKYASQFNKIQQRIQFIMSINNKKNEKYLLHLRQKLTQSIISQYKSKIQVINNQVTNKACQFIQKINILINYVQYEQKLQQIEQTILNLHNAVVIVKQNVQKYLNKSEQVGQILNKLDKICTFIHQLQSKFSKQTNIKKKKKNISLYNYFSKQQIQNKSQFIVNTYYPEMEYSSDNISEQKTAKITQNSIRKLQQFFIRVSKKLKRKLPLGITFDNMGYSKLKQSNKYLLNEKGFIFRLNNEQINYLKKKSIIK